MHIPLARPQQRGDHAHGEDSDDVDDPTELGDQHGIRNDHDRAYHQRPELEAAVGQRLFKKDGRKNALTEAGRMVQRYAEEIEDPALMKVMAAEGRGFIILPAAVSGVAMKRYGLHVFGRADDCRVSFHAFTAERRTEHPAVAAITRSKAWLEASGPNASGGPRPRARRGPAS